MQSRSREATVTQRRQGVAASFTYLYLSFLFTSCRKTIKIKKIGYSPVNINNTIKMENLISSIDDTIFRLSLAVYDLLTLCLGATQQQQKDVRIIVKQSQKYKINF